MYENRAQNYAPEIYAEIFHVIHLFHRHIISHVQAIA